MPWDQLLPSQFSPLQPDDKVGEGFRLLSNTHVSVSQKFAFCCGAKPIESAQNLTTFLFCVYFGTLVSCVLLQERGRLLPESMGIHAS